MPISYSGRSYQEGKKIGWRDGLKALAAIVRFRISDEVYVKDAYGSRTPRAPEPGAEVQRLDRRHGPRRSAARACSRSAPASATSRCSSCPARTFVASDVNPLHLTTLASLCTDRPYLSVAYCDVSDRASFPARDGGYDTVVCVNVIAYIADDVQALANIRAVLADGAVPWSWSRTGRGSSAPSTRRWDTSAAIRRASLTAVAEAAGFEVQRILRFNRRDARLVPERPDAAPAHFGLVQIKLLGLLAPIIRRSIRICRCRR